MKALNVRVDNLSLSRAKRMLARFVESGQYHQVVTVNPDFVMLARKNTIFQNVINEADLSLADGVGLNLPAFLQGIELKERIPGSDLTEYLLAYAQEKQLIVFLLARADGLSSYVETKAAILQRYPRSIVRGLDVNTHSQEAINHALAVTHGNIILCNFGAPEQDIFLARLKQVPDSDALIGMGVGGTFDFLTGKLRRAPLIIRRLGLEWLWRLILQPRRRLKRTFNYVVIYSLLCMREAFVAFWNERVSTPFLEKVSLRSRF
ncbi:MAG: WecB/TagA/CpsF family glycosyltransferase [Candidatus Moraniibacteriota bacterium]